MRLTTRLLLSTRRDQRDTRLRLRALMLSNTAAGQFRALERLKQLRQAVCWLQGRLYRQLADERMVECALGEAAYDGVW